MPITRRGLLTGAAIGGGLLVAWTLYPRHFPNPIEPREGEEVFDAWLKIATDGVVTVAVPQLEMGQGVTTLLPQIVAAELGADWRQVAVEPAPGSAQYANVPLAARWAPLWMPFAPGLAGEPDAFLARRFAEDRRFSATGDGTSLAAFEAPCRQAGAAARAMLAQAAADRWGVSWEECEASGGFIRYGDQQLSFGELVAEAVDYDPPDPPPLRPVAYAEDALPGEAGGNQAYPRLDLPSKVDGTHQFAGDVRLPGLVYAAIRHGPIDKAELVEFNPFNARGIRGIVGAVEGKRWLAVCATSWWAAEQALDTMHPRFSVEHLVDSNEIERRLDDALATGSAYRIFERGDADEGMDSPDLALRYDFEPGVHATLETSSATARFADGRLELWIASQAPEQARVAAARALDIAVEDVVLYPMPAGGSFDRRYEHDHAIEVALIAREIGRPVQLIWSRWQELLAGRPRSPAAVVLRAKLSQDGEARISAMRTRIAMPPANLEFGRRLFDNSTSWAAIRDTEGAVDAMAGEGAVPPYAIPAVAVDHIPVEIGLPVSRMRGNAHGYNCFALESFIDELASRNGREPVSYRMMMLGSDPRLAACLQRAAQLAGWDGGVDQSGNGIACHRIGDAASGGRIACVATARAGEGGVLVTRLSAAVDIGRIVNLDIARQQIEGGLVFGLAMAMGASTRYAGGLPQSQQLGALNLPRLADCPDIEVEFIASDAPSADPGELGAVVAAPAIANALYS
ncbi:MAG TPA: molybdopterin cofactor-binding domain-containing protein, partial [Erythrobacter sp.]|nr:molybdopterin cofactor-binding domain-containing protein [Erythrobacter sp.]